MRELLPWSDWPFALSSLVRSLFPFSLVRPGDTVVQVGANRFQASVPGSSQPLLLAQCLQGQGRLIIVDSEMSNVEVMKQIREQLNLPVFEVLHRAVSDRAEEITGIDADGHDYFYDWRTSGDRQTSAKARPELNDIWNYVERKGTTITIQAERLETILSSMNANPSYVNLTINGYEPNGIRGMGRFLDGDVVISFVARVTEAFWGNGFLEELEERGFTLVLSNMPHSYDERESWFPYITALRPHQLPRCGGMVLGTFGIDPQTQVLTFVDANGQRLY